MAAAAVADDDLEKRRDGHGYKSNDVCGMVKTSRNSKSSTHMGQRLFSVKAL